MIFWLSSMIPCSGPIDQHVAERQKYNRGVPVQLWTVFNAASNTLWLPTPFHKNVPSRNSNTSCINLPEP
ncbi:hypothetical protein BDV37DRAFT_247067 [Aspergillus pseudonomiae]|uniref:Uncharacterized protein n=1 Tax=Aspergillus pseudonomiae TaxID=1506151 RepID=A0A5N7DDW5_9EURO|nr:uncharacterized protein BDV37DRAFT_247067 [Aspergillus pseudonomiae]KAE8404581.1 hypothetical protein BDV37DRAFT_247067 [Aspergillus pseudonomiae]